MTTVNIDPAVALREERALAEHYRNRALLNAQAHHETAEKLKQNEAAGAAEKGAAHGT